MTLPRAGAADLLVALVDGGVEFVVVGGVAVQAHGHPRTTQDLDILVRRTPENHARLADVLDRLGAEDVAEELAGFLTLDPRDPVDLARAGMLAVHTPAGRLDVLNRAPGADDFDAVYARALVLTFRGREVRAAGLDDLVAMKRAAGREQDKRDIAALTQLDNERD